MERNACAARRLAAGLGLVAIIFIAQAGATDAQTFRATVVNFSGANDPSAATGVVFDAAAPCSEVQPLIFSDDATVGDSLRLQVKWDASPDVLASAPEGAVAAGSCSSVSLFADPGCGASPILTLARPSKVDGAYPATEQTLTGLPASVKCEISTGNQPETSPTADEPVTSPPGDQPVISPPDACAGTDCGSATCVLKNGAAECACKEGLVFNAATKQCDGVCSSKPCGAEADCVVKADGTPDCVCKLGQVFNAPDKTCKTPPSPCVAAQCPPLSSCAVVNGAAKCSCDKGLEMKDGKCVATSGTGEPAADPCAAAKCQVNSQCTVVNGKAEC
ncbi:hypothetical protein CLOM_g18563 [Closterium sp. NIES-68]|nr:hypothetical protein CLOM_g18563 [Closterium sp. NIES-68]GJP60076.1 hypothetical protein CLOP_g17215 [Closterium sp. NIES-67]